jgi:hypothetical protein
LVFGNYPLAINSLANDKANVLLSDVEISVLKAPQHPVGARNSQFLASAVLPKQAVPKLSSAQIFPENPSQEIKPCPE